MTPPLSNPPRKILQPKQRSLHWSRPTKPPPMTVTQTVRTAQRGRGALDFERRRPSRKPTAAAQSGHRGSRSWTSELTNSLQSWNRFGRSVVVPWIACLPCSSLFYLSSLHRPKPQRTRAPGTPPTSGAPRPQGGDQGMRITRGLGIEAIAAAAATAMEAGCGLEAGGSALHSVKLVSAAHPRALRAHQRNTLVQGHPVPGARVTALTLSPVGHGVAADPS